jgi:hypothetical protein
MLTHGFDKPGRIELLNRGRNRVVFLRRRTEFPWVVTLITVIRSPWRVRYAHRQYIPIILHGAMMQRTLHRQSLLWATYMIEEKKSVSINIHSHVILRAAPPSYDSIPFLSIRRFTFAALHVSRVSTATARRIDAAIEIPSDIRDWNLNKIPVPFSSSSRNYWVPRA